MKVSKEIKLEENKDSKEPELLFLKMKLKNGSQINFKKNEDSEKLQGMDRDFTMYDTDL